MQEPKVEEDWIDSPEGRVTLQELREEVEEELRKADPLYQWMHGVQFCSQSNGKGRKPRRDPREVTLIQFNGDHQAGR